MKVLNIHRRIISQPITTVAQLLSTLATKDDQVWPYEQWPRMKFKEGLKVGSRGGHGPIRYTIEQFDPGKLIRFTFTKPAGFHGFHQLEIRAVDEKHTEVQHTINMHVKGFGIFIWLLGVRQLHDALIEDAFDKIENHFSREIKRTEWSVWVNILRWALG